METTSYCDGSTSQVVTEMSCFVPVSVLTADPYSLTAGTTVIAIVRAHNARGWSEYSPENTAGAIIVTVPHKMANVARDDSQTTTSYITVSWTALSEPENGMSTVLSYALEWDGGSSGSMFSELVGESTNYLLTTFTVSTGVSPGGTYQFKVRARNGLGWGDYSDAVSIKAATNPEQITSLT